MQAERKISGPFVLAPGVIFDAARHEYYLRGKQLSGVTRLIGRRLGTKMPEEFVGEVRTEGLHVHSALEEWVGSRGARCNSVHPGVLWLTESIIGKCAKKPLNMHAEVLVSDLLCYASAVDIIAEYENKELELFDMKRSFSRPSVTWQLSIYKYLIEKFTDYRVIKMWCAAFRDKEYYPIFPKTVKEVEELLYGKAN